MRPVLLLIFTLAIIQPVLGKDKLQERDYQKRFCAGMALEIPTPSGARADCVSETHAIEVDWSKKWAEAIGQSLHYASELNLKAGIVLVCKKALTCSGHAYRLESTIKAYKLPIDVWFCRKSDKTLADCAFDEGGQ